MLKYPGRRWRRRLVFWLLGLLVLVNVMAYNHAWHFTHFGPAEAQKTARPEKMGMLEKAKVLLTGISNPKPALHLSPDVTFDTIQLKAEDGTQLEAWLIKTDSVQAKGTFLLCHGYTGRKSDLLEEGKALRAMGFNTLLLDLRGHGGSGGSVTTVGYHEAQDVKAAVNWLQQNTEMPVYIYGMSMGAVASLRAVAVYDLPVQGLILEAPFKSMISTVRNRFHLMGVPSWPFADLLVFWGGQQHGFNGFEHDATTYAGQTKLPCLMLMGAEDARVPLEDAKALHQSFSGAADIVVFQHLEHQSLLRAAPEKWKASVNDWLSQNFARHDSKKAGRNLPSQRP